jgi:hypothetical protein
MTTRSLFILKRREDYGDDPSYSASYQIATGMYNSAKFVVDELVAAGREAKVVLVIDANDIDREVTSYNPTHVFVEGLWVTPAKFDELLAIKRHQDRKWHVRIHSEIPFLATEGVAFDWIPKYMNSKVMVAPNAPRAHEQITWLANRMHLTEDLVPLLPNCYPTNFSDFPLQNLNTKDKDTFDIAIFGAYRPMKNHLQQAFVAMKYAEHEGKKCRIHVNMRTDAGGGGPAKNVVNAVAAAGYELVNHDWEDRDTFLASLGQIDLLLQESMSETFNIVAADATLVGRPMLVSDEINWAYPVYGNPQSVADSLKKLQLVMSNKPFFINGNRAGLSIYANSARRRWLKYIPV